MNQTKEPEATINVITTLSMTGTGGVNECPADVMKSASILVVAAVLDDLVLDDFEVGLLTFDDLEECAEGAGVGPLASVDGVDEGTSLGSDEGIMEGASLGSADGTSLGSDEGILDGVSLGADDGMSLGCDEGSLDGIPPLGVDEGTWEGIDDGDSLGSSDGIWEGLNDGVSDGLPVGEGVCA